VSAMSCMVCPNIIDRVLSSACRGECLLDGVWLLHLLLPSSNFNSIIGLRGRGYRCVAAQLLCSSGEFDPHFVPLYNTQVLIDIGREAILEGKIVEGRVLIIEDRQGNWT
ncbi:MAG: hypothetical protein MUQ10_17605, partial [Anaerolineae bacterium]|nr:hypothetical protein [Anaerolineae bacterium]